MSHDNLPGFGRAARASIEITIDEDKMNILDKFESLGDNCEFGLVQRKFGVERLGLLRFNFIFPDALIWMLNVGFDKVGDLDYTEVVPSKNEYFVKDTRISGMAMHTFTKPGTVDHEPFVAQTLRRVSYLKEKLLEDLAEGEKIFVHKIDAPMADEQFARLKMAIRRHNPSIRLFVVWRGKSAGEVVQIEPGIFIGQLSTVWGGDLVTLDGLCFEEWVKLCTHVLQQCRM